MDSRAFIAWMPDGRIAIANRELADLVDQPASRLIGRTIDDMVEQYWADPSTAAPAVDLIRSGGVETIRVESALHRDGLPTIPVEVWARAIELGDRGWATAAYVIPMPGNGERPADSMSVCAALDCLVLGLLDANGRFLAIGGDVAGVLGAHSEEAIGSSLAAWIQSDCPAGAASQLLIDRPREVSLSHVASRTASLLWACLPGEPAERVVAMQLAPISASRATDRVAELERRISRIAAEVNAAGLLPATPAPGRERVAELATLTGRQWDILSRLLSGMTSAEIGAELFLSPSTVRNHLSAIFRKFGVHTQIELLRVIGSAG